MKLTLCALFSICLIPGLVLAMEPGHIRDPDRLPELKNKIVVLEYENPRPSAWGLELSKVLTREIIGSMEGVSSFGVVNLRQDRASVSLSAEEISAIAKRQQASIVIWGEFFEAENKVFLHSHLKIFRPQKSPDVGLGISFATATGTLTATPTTYLINFAPIEISSATLRELTASQEQSAAIRIEPSDDAKIVGKLKTDDGFSVTEARNGWMHVRANNSTGWVRYATVESRKELNELGAIVRLADGTLQYLTGEYKGAEINLSKYLRENDGRQDARNRAFAHVLLGNTRFKQLRAVSEIPRSETCSEEYLSAAKLLPSQAAPWNYLAVVRFLKHRDEKELVAGMQELESGLIRFIQTQNDEEALKNLRILYQSAGSGYLRPKDLSPAAYDEQLQRQIAALDEIAAKLGYSSGPTKPTS